MIHRIVVIFLCFIAFLSEAQEIVVPKGENKAIDYSQIIKKHLNANPPKDSVDSVYVNSYIYLDRLLKADSIRRSFASVKRLISTNRVQNELLQLYGYRNKVDSLNKKRHSLLSDYWLRQSLQQNSDTGMVSTEDTLFYKTLEAVVYQDTINFDSLLRVLNPYNDTLLMAIDASIKNYKNHEYTRWIKSIRNDTIGINLVNIDGDSLTIFLYNDNPSIIHFGLSDYWGSQMPAVIRNIEKRSFKIFIDDGPVLDYNVDDKAKQALDGLAPNRKIRRLTINRIPVIIQKPKWNIGGNVNVAVSQVGMYQWAQGGDPSFSVLAGVELFAKYTKEKISWENTGKFRYGVIRQGRYSDTTIHFRSSEDKMEMATKLGYKVFGQQYLSFEGDFKSQFTPTYKWAGSVKTEEKISDFMSPAYLTMSLGLDFKPNDNANLFTSPFTTKTTFVYDELNSIKERYGVDTTMNARVELGARIKFDYKTKIWEDIEIKNSLELFSSYLKNPQNVDVIWEFAIVLPVNDYINAKILTNMIYDDDTKVPVYEFDNGVEIKRDGRGLQFREIIAIGFSAKF